MKRRGPSGPRGGRPRAGAKAVINRIHDPERIEAIRGAIQSGRYDTLGKIDAILENFLGDAGRSK